MTRFRIRALREARGMTRYELAQAAAVSYQAIAQWENGVVAPSADKLPVLAAMLDCEVGDLYDDKALRAASEAARAAVAAKGAADARALAAGK